MRFIYKAKKKLKTLVQQVFFYLSPTSSKSVKWNQCYDNVYVNIYGTYCAPYQYAIVLENQISWNWDVEQKDISHNSFQFFINATLFWQIFPMVLHSKFIVEKSLWTYPTNLLGGKNEMWMANRVTRLTIQGMKWMLRESFLYKNGQLKFPVRGSRRKMCHVRLGYRENVSSKLNRCVPPGWGGIYVMKSGRICCSQRAKKGQHG